MKEIVFRPLRIIKKTGKITVASYSQWRNIKTSDNEKFRLIIDRQYKTFPKEKYVHDHNGENLFWMHYNPEEIPVHNSIIFDDEYEQPKTKMWKTDWGMFCAKGLDVDGVPRFSHGTSDEIYNGKVDMKDLEPLTVETVNYWVGWFLYKLKNAEIIYKPT